MDSHISSPTHIEVVDPQVREAVKNYIIYTLNGTDSNGQFKVERRYSDFEALRKTLLARWPGCFIPPIPPKKTIGNFDQSFIEERRRFLDLFCKRIAQLPHLFYSEEFEIFKRTASQESVLNALPRETPNDLINKYSKAFADLAGV